MNEKLNLGCGCDYREGWVNADIRPELDPDILLDLDYMSLPFETDTFERILLDNVLEHVDDQLGVLHELHRISAPNAHITFRGPHWNSHGAWIDPTHKRPFSHKTFEHNLVNDLFIIEELHASRISFGRLLPEKCALLLSNYIGNLVDEIDVTVRVKK